MERFGRRTWLLIGSAGMMGSLLLLAFAFQIRHDRHIDRLQHMEGKRAAPLRSRPRRSSPRAAAGSGRAG